MHEWEIDHDCYTTDDWRFDCTRIVGFNKLSVWSGTRTPERVTVFLSGHFSSHFFHLLEGTSQILPPNFGVTLIYLFFFVTFCRWTSQRVPGYHSDLHAAPLPSSSACCCSFGYFVSSHIRPRNASSGLLLGHDIILVIIITYNNNVLTLLAFLLFLLHKQGSICKLLIINPNRARNRGVQSSVVTVLMIGAVQ